MRAEDGDQPHVRLTPESGHSAMQLACPLMQLACPLWVKSRTYAVHKAMSALPPKATSNATYGDIC
jgi:hypothetical protein